MLSLKKRIYRLVFLLTTLILFLFSLYIWIYADVCWQSYATLVVLVYALGWLGAYLITNVLMKDIEGLKRYLEALNKKEYETPVSKSLHLEFLEISVLLKNIVKRLHAKKEKKKKKR